MVHTTGVVHSVGSHGLSQRIPRDIPWDKRSYGIYRTGTSHETNDRMGSPIGYPIYSMEYHAVCRAVTPGTSHGKKNGFLWYAKVVR